MPATPVDPLDPTGLIAESYRIDAITAGECRSIFLDWALGLPAGADLEAARSALLSRYVDVAPDHPMTSVLREGLGTAAQPRRRGGWRGRPRD